MAVNKNLDQIQNNIRKSLLKCGEPGRKVTLVAVTKGRSAELVKDALAAGLEDIGENYLPEFLPKYESFKDKARFHFIGHLQRNKASKVTGRAYLIHSLDSVRLAEAVNREARQQGIIQQVLVEINIGNEESKYGIRPGEAVDFVKKLVSFTNLKVMGLMGMAPFIKPEETRPFFKSLHSLYIIIKKKKFSHTDMKFLSMGMSNDYTIAVEEGSNMVRIGTELFKEDR